MIITKAAIKHKITVFTGLIILMIVGMDAYFKLPRESAPDIPIPIILVTTVYPGVSPTDIEKLVTIPIEKKLKELSGVDELSSVSTEGVSSIQVEFSPNVDLDQAFQKVRDKVDLAKPDLPEDVEEPLLNEVNVSEFPIAVVNLVGNSDVSRLKLKQLAEDIQEKIELIQGVLDANISGDVEREIQIIPDPRKLKFYEISLNDLITAIQTENVNIPGGNMDIGNMKYMVRVSGEFSKVNEIQDIVVKANEGNPVFVRDLAQVKDDFKERLTYARFNGEDSLSITVRKRAGENIITIVDEVKKIIDEVNQSTSDKIKCVLTFDESKEIKSMVNELENNIISGVFLIIIVIFFFMGFKNSFFVALAIPFSMLLTFLVIDLVGYTLNMVVLFSLILAVGMLVDNAVVIVENIYRHLEEGYSLFDASYLGTKEVGWPVITSTSTTVAAFFPMIFWPDIIGEFMSYLPKTVIIVLLASLFIAFVVNPVFCSVFMKLKAKRIDKEKDGTVKHGGLYKFYEKVLKFSLNHRFIVTISCLVLLIIIFALYGRFGKGVEFFPDIDPKRVYIDITYPEGTNLDVSNRTCQTIEEILFKKKELQYVITNVGTQSDAKSSAFGGGGAGSTNLSRILLEFYDFEDRKRPSNDVIEELRTEIDKLSFPGAIIEFQKEQPGPPQDEPVKIEILGENLEILKDLTQRIKRQIEPIQGLVDLKDDFEKGRPEFNIDINREMASRFKMSTHLIASTIRTAVNGIEVSSFRDGDEEYDITVRYPEDHRKSINDLKNLVLTNHDSEMIHLSRIAKISPSSGWGAITRKDSRRTVSITGNNLEGVNLNELLNRVKTELKDFPFPPGYFIRFSGQQEDQDKSSQFLMRAFLMAVAMIIFILVTEFNSITMPLVIMASVFLSLFGVFSGLLITGTPFGIIMTGIGVISLAGVVVNNAIVLIDYIHQLRERNMDRFSAVVKAGVTRLRPVLLTAITTIAGLIPLTTGYGWDFRKGILVTGSESSEWWGPMGIAVIFGLTFATVLTLVVVPVMYTMVDDLEHLFSKKKKS